MAAELRLDMRTDGYVRVRDLLKLNLQTFAKVPLKSHTVDEIREVLAILLHDFISLIDELLSNLFGYLVCAKHFFFYYYYS